MTDPKLEQEALCRAAFEDYFDTDCHDPVLLPEWEQWQHAWQAALSQQRAVPEVTDEMVEIVGKQLWRYWDDVKGAAARTYRNKTRKALEDALAAAPSPEQEK